MRIAILTMLLGLLAPAAEAAVLYVDRTAIFTGAGDGTSWADAFTDLQDALAVAESGDEIWVAEGDYRPGDGSDRSATFRLVDGVTLYGGFQGGESSVGERFWEFVETRLCGAVGEPGDSVFERGDNLHHVVTAVEVGEGTVLDGVTICHGYAEATVSGTGAGLRIVDASPVIRNSVIRDCLVYPDIYGAAGGGVLAEGDSWPRFENVDFVNNYSGTPWTQGGRAGAFYGTGEFHDVRFIGNGAGVVGGVSGSGILEDCWFEGNGTYMGTSALSGFFDVRRTTFIGNGNYNGVTATTVNNQFRMQDCHFIGNGLPMSIDDTFSGTVPADHRGPGTLTNVTFRDRDGLVAGTIVADHATTLANILCSGVFVGARRVPFDRPPPADAPPVVLVNSTVTQWVETTGRRLVVANSIVGDGFSTHEAVVMHRPGSVEVDHSSVFGSGGSATWDAAYGIDRGGNIDADPVFLARGTGDLRLTFTSPAINAGDADLLPATLLHDLDGNPRVYGPTVDMGAYEYQGPGIRDLFAARFTPRSLHPESNGRFVRVELTPEWSFGVDEIEAEGLLLNDSVAPLAVKGGRGRLRLVFDRQEVAAALAPGREVTVTVAGSMRDGTPFLAVDAIQVLDPGDPVRDDPDLESGGPVVSEMELLPRSYLRAAPNPFNPSTTIRFGLTRDGYTELAIYDLAGRRVKTLVAGPVRAGEHRRDWDGRDDAGHRVASGVYLSRLRAADFVETQRLVLVK